MIPTLSDSTFASLGVSEVLCDAIRKLNWKSPTVIQQQAIPVALSGKDVIGLAATGSGKTGAFAIPVIQALLQDPTPYCALVLAPTHELAFQIAEQFDALGAVVGLRTCVIVGGVDTTQQALALARKPHVIIATPGRILHHLETTKGFSLRNLRFLVLDEADRMLSMNFEEALSRIVLELPQQRRTFLFSATMTSSVSKLERASLRDPVKVSVTNNKFGTVAELRQSYLLMPAKWKHCYLAHLMAEFSGSSIMIFCGACQTATRVSLILQILGLTAVVLTGQMSQKARLLALTRFRASEKTILVATDVASRGLDIPSVDLVINFDMPTAPKDYVHRVGRTARAGRAGNAITFVTQYDVEMFKRIEGLVGLRLAAHAAEEREVLTLLPQVETADKLATDRMREADQTDKERKKKTKKARQRDANFANDAGDSERSAALGFIKKAKVQKKSLQ
jgi:ATP-dependent RNA helicase DDX47/RRP3